MKNAILVNIVQIEQESAVVVGGGCGGEGVGVGSTDPVSKRLIAVVATKFSENELNYNRWWSSGSTRTKHKPWLE